jgi:hypothetical protein
MSNTYYLILTPSSTPGTTEVASMTHQWQNANQKNIDGPLSADVGDTLNINFEAWGRFGRRLNYSLK